MFQKVVINLLYVLGLVLFGYILGVYVSRPSVSIDSLDVEKVDSLLVSREREIIDSLNLVISDYKKLNSDLRDSIKVITVVRTVKVGEVKKLPLDSGVVFLNQKLREFEYKFD